MYQIKWIWSENLKRIQTFFRFPTHPIGFNQKAFGHRVRYPICTCSVASTRSFWKIYERCDSSFFFWGNFQICSVCHCVSYGSCLQSHSNESLCFECVAPPKSQSRSFFSVKRVQLLNHTELHTKSTKSTCTYICTDGNIKNFRPQI